MKQPAFVSVTASIVLAACAAPSGDPCASANSDVNLATLIGNSVSGSYEQCLSSMRAELQSLRLEAANLRQQASTLERQAALLDGEQRAATARLASLNTEQARLLDQIAAAESSATDAQIQSAVSEANTLNRQVESLNRSGTASDAEAAEIRARQQRLNRLADVMLQ